MGRTLPLAVLEVSPREGTLRYNITDGYVDNIGLTGDVRIEEVSQDHLLFEASFKSRPELKANYSCKMR